MNRTATAETPHQDNLFGVCNALGEDFGFNPLWLRLALAVAFLFRPEIVVAGYFAVGAVVLATRLAFPDRKTAPAGAAPAPALERVATERAVTEERVEFARAA